MQKKEIINKGLQGNLVVLSRNGKKKSGFFAREVRQEVRPEIVLLPANGESWNVCWLILA